jgi:hypothetical protein
MKKRYRVIKKESITFVTGVFFKFGVEVRVGESIVNALYG